MRRVVLNVMVVVVVVEMSYLANDDGPRAEAEGRDIEAMMGTGGEWQVSKWW